MVKKFITGIVLFLILCVSGCALPGGEKAESTVTPVPTEIPKDTEIIEGMKTSKTPAGKVVGQEDEEILELKHWKYGSERAQPAAQQQSSEQPVPPQPPQQPQLPTMDNESNSWEAVSLQIISEEEMVQIVRQLIAWGYLTEPVSHQEFEDAIRNFQRDNSLPITGKLDGPTRELLKGK